MINNYLTKALKLILLFGCLLLSQSKIYAQDPGDRAQKFRGTWWGGVHASLLDDDLLSLKTIDGWRVILTRGATESALHFAPVPLLSDLDGADEVFPPNNDTAIQNQLNKIENAGYMVQVYNNSENFIGGNQPQFEEFAESWKEWCDTNPQAQAFINSQSYHRKAGFPNRHYMFCYAEFVVKYYSLQYGKQIDLWTFDAGHVMVANGDSDTSGNVEEQRLYLAFADAARAGNDDIAVAFNNGRSNLNFPGYPYAHATRADDFTFGHAFGGNGNHAEKVNGNQFNLNYQHVSRMTATNGYVHDEGRETWDDNIVGHFSSKLSTAAWDFGGTPAWEQDDFNEWNEEALLAGGMMTWYGSNNRANSFVYDWVYPQLKALDDYLFERGISINAENNGNPILPDDEDSDKPVTGIEISPNNVTLKIDETQQLNAEVNPTTATNKNYSWASSNENIATVDENGIVTAISEGTATITATTEDGSHTDTSTIRVLAPDTPIIDVTNIEISSELPSLEVNDTAQLSAEISPADATNQNFTWQSSDHAIATIDASGLITAISEGVVTITATSQNGAFSDTITINIIDNTPPLEEEEEEVLIEKITIYPNPTTSEMIMNIPLNTAIQIYDISGRTMVTKKILTEDDKTIDISTLVQGTYYVHIYETTGITTLKVIKL